MEILSLCDRFRALPSQVLAEDAMLLQMIAIEGALRGE